MTTRQRFSFRGALDAPVAGILDLPDAHPRGCFLYAHCFTCSKDTIASARISRALVDAGFASARIDFTGLGESGGRFADTSFSTNVEDLVLAAEHLHTLGHAPGFLVGHSLGGAAVLAASQHVPGLRAVATVAAPCSVAQVERHLTSGLEAIERDGAADVILAGRPVRIGRGFVRDLPRHDLPAIVAALGVPTIFLHAADDEQVPFAQAEQLCAAARKPKELISLEAADHMLARRGSATEAGGLIADRFGRYAV